MLCRVVVSVRLTVFSAVLANSGPIDEKSNFGDSDKDDQYVSSHDPISSAVLNESPGIQMERTPKRAPTTATRRTGRASTYLSH